MERFLNDGAEVATCDIDAAALKSLPELALAEQVDVADDPAFVAFIDKATATLGGLDCLVNNAGIAGPTAPIEQIDPAAWSARWFSC